MGTCFKSEPGKHEPLQSDWAGNSDFRAAR
jgi:hypothetical protein